MDVEIDLDELLGDGQSMPSYLKCPVCLDSLNDPRMLSCSHTVCCACLDNLMRFSNERPSNGNGAGKIISCPVCRRKLTMLSAEKLLQNRGLAEAVSDWKRREKEGQFARFQNFIKYCSAHKTSLADHWCDSCSSNICNLCLSSENTHVDHEVENIEDIESFSCARANLLSGILSIQEKIPDIVSRLHKVLTHEFDVKEAYFQWCKDVTDQEARAHSIIADKFKNLRTSGQATTNETVNSLRNERTSGFEALKSIDDFFSSAPSIMKSKTLHEDSICNPSESALSNIANFLEVTERTFKANIRDFKEGLESPLTKIRDTVDKLQSGNLHDPRRRSSNRQHHVINGRVTSRHGSGRRGNLNPRFQPQQIRLIQPGARIHILGRTLTPSQPPPQPNHLLQPNIFLPQQHQLPPPQSPFALPYAPRFATSNGPLFFSFTNPVGPNPAAVPRPVPSAAAGAPPPPPPSTGPVVSNSVLLTPLSNGGTPAVSSASSSTPVTDRARGTNDMGNFFVADRVHPVETVVRTEPSNRPSTAPNPLPGPVQSGLGNPSTNFPLSSIAVDTSYESHDQWTDSGMDISDTSTPSALADSAQADVWSTNGNGLTGERRSADETRGSDRSGVGAASEGPGAGFGSGRDPGAASSGAGVRMEYSSYGPASDAAAASPALIRRTPDHPPPLNYPPGRLQQESVRDIPLPPDSPPPYQESQRQSPTWARYQNQNANNSNWLGQENFQPILESPDLRRDDFNLDDSSSHSWDRENSPWRSRQQSGYVNDHTYYDSHQYANDYYIEDGYDDYNELDLVEDENYNNLSQSEYVEHYNSSGESSLNHLPIETVRRRGQPSLQGRRLYAPRNLIRLPLARENLTARIDQYGGTRRHSIDGTNHETEFMETHL